jgi:hypothetical protein
MQSKNGSLLKAMNFSLVLVDKYSIMKLTKYGEVICYINIYNKLASKTVSLYVKLLLAYFYNCC